MGVRAGERWMEWREGGLDDRDGVVSPADCGDGDRQRIMIIKIAGVPRRVQTDRR